MKNPYLFFSSKTTLVGVSLPLIILSVPTKKVHPKVLDGTMNSEALTKLKELEIKENKSSENEESTDPRWDKLKSLITEKNT